MSARAFRDWFVKAWSIYLQQHFHSPSQVHQAFKGAIAPQTAHNWYYGLNRASGDTVAQVMMFCPDALPFFRAQWDRDQERR